MTKDSADLTVRKRMRVLDHLWVKIFLGLLTAGLLTCSLPAPDLGWLAWVALAPLIIACHELGPLGAGGLGFVTGLAANFGLFRWLFVVPGFGLHHYVILGIYFALYPAAWCAGISLSKRQHVPLIFAAPALWVALDYLRAHAGFMAFPWGTLAQTQHQNLAVLQIATITGEYGVTFLVVMANTAIAETILALLSPTTVEEPQSNSPLWKRGARGDFPSTVQSKSSSVPLFQREKQQNLRRESNVVWRRVFVAALIIVLAHGWGAFVLFAERPGPTIRVAAVQPNILRGERDTAEGRAVALNRLARLTKIASLSHPALIAWPETAVAGNLRANPLLAADLMALAHDVSTSLVLGVGEVEKLAMRDAEGNMRRRAYNSAYVVTPGTPLEAPYIKRVLLPFGEYVPLEGVIRWPAWLAPPVIKMVVGNAPNFYTLSDGTVLAPLICWENLFASLARESVRGGARLLVVVTNDGWFGRTAEPLQHNLASVLRAVENRVPIVVSSNTGPSQIIDPYGRIVASAAHIFSEEVVTAEVQSGSGGTPYMYVGDLFVFVILAGLATCVARRFFRKQP